MRKRAALVRALSAACCACLAAGVLDAAELRSAETRPPAPAVQPAAQQAAQPAAPAGVRFARAAGRRAWSFPRDHGQHPRYRLEWWYYTGIVRTREGRAFGYQATFFRQGLRPGAAAGASAWRTGSLYLAHLAVSDIERNGYRYATRAGRDSLALSGAAEDRHRVWLNDWRVEPLEGAGQAIRIEARDQSIGIALTLDPATPPVLHGDRGLDQKGAQPGQASWYYSLPRMRTSGEIFVGADHWSVTGTSWMDHEFGTSQLGEDQVGWDWFSVRLDSGLDLMVYRLRTRSGNASPSSGGTLVAASGRATRVRLVDRSDGHAGPTEVFATATAEGVWISPATKAHYPLFWTIRIPSVALTLTIKPAMNDQEIPPGAGLPFGYWEGAIWVRGSQAGKPVQGEGYLELTGYSGDLNQSFR